MEERIKAEKYAILFKNRGKDFILSELNPVKEPIDLFY
jgi:hypothetical protein